MAVAVLVRGGKGARAADALDGFAEGIADADAPQAAAATVYKVVDSAVANAESTEHLSRGDLVVAKAFVDEGPTLKRHRPRAQGRTNEPGSSTLP